MITAAITLLLAHAAPGFRSEVTGKPEHVGQCFTSTVKSKFPRLDGEPDYGDGIGFADGHQTISTQTVPAIRRSRVGDPVRLCVTDIPKGCPPTDHAGIGYRVKNLRTGEVWEDGDFSHTC